MKARAVVGRREESPLRDPSDTIYWEGQGESKCEGNIMDGKKKSVDEVRDHIADNGKQEKIRAVCIRRPRAPVRCSHRRPVFQPRQG